jgi:hypothetical protein
LYAEFMFINTLAQGHASLEHAEATRG